MKIRSLISGIAGIAVGFSVLLCGCATTHSASKATYEKFDFQVRRNSLYRDKTNFCIKAFDMPTLGKQGSALSVMVPAMAKVADVGGNTVCFDLPGLSADGKALDPQTFAVLDTYTERGKAQGMAIVVRVLGDSTDPEFRKRAVRTAAKALRPYQRAVYLIDGPDAAELAAKFKKIAPALVLISPENGDIKLVSKAPTRKSRKLLLVDGELPNPELGEIPFLLADKEENYQALDQMLMRPEEKVEWKLDDSILSEEEKAEGFVPLFDGKTLDGWWMCNDNPNAFHVSEDGFIEWRMTGGRALMSAKRYDNFILRMQWKILPGGNSGLWLRAPRNARQSKIGMEFQMRGDTGTKEPDKSNTGAVYDVLPPMSFPAKYEGLWNDLEVTFDGPHLKAIMNGELVQDVNFDEHEELKYRLRKGFISLTDHNCYVAFRNIRIKELK